MSSDTVSSTVSLQPFQMSIDGRRVGAVSGRTFTSYNPYTGEPWAEVPDAGAEDADRAVAAARHALEGPWGQGTGFYRADLLRRLADVLADNAERLARLEVQDTGKLFREVGGVIAYLPEWYRYFSGLADKLEGKTIPSDKPNFFVYTRREPVGVVAAITPWNSPLLLLTMKLAAGLAAGCTFVIKPSEYAPVSTLAFAELFQEVGFPPGVVNVICGVDRGLGAHLAGHSGIDKVAFTGSSATGASVASAAGANLNRVTLELGGKSPHIVFPDADLAAAANGLIAGVFAATGQTCMAGSRLIAHESVHDELISLVVDRVKQIRLGDPNDPDTDMGPVANRPQYDKVLGYLEGASAQGAVVAVGGGPSSELGGLFVEPTVLTSVTEDMTVAREEVFGPVLAAYTFTDEAEALRLANATAFGLAGAVWTKDIHRAHRVASKLKAGSVWINAYRVIGPDVPFGGFGASGIGRENGVETVNEYTEVKSVWVELSGGTRDPFKMG